jgi:class 3 adenylate cyclase/tetratricopeptide (TPR) repeat protein
VLFCDLTGSTELGEKLDPEALRALLARYFDRMKAIVESHGGSVEKFIGDAVMAVFGVPVLHEDDALRALRAATEMRDAFPELGIQGRIGVTTGEVVTGTTERLATGDAVNVAARLEQVAQPGEILIGEETLRLTRDAVEVEPLEPVALKGKSARVPAHRLLSVHGQEGFARRLDAAMVGREREQRLLKEAWGRVVSERSCQLFTLLGAAGVGKSRLAAEFLEPLDASVTVRGRCLPYGEGITYWPVVEALRQLPVTEADPAAAGIMRALSGNEPLTTSSEDIAWAFRKQLEAVAAVRPVVCVFDDLHWGEETFLDLVEHIADLSRDAPILLLCMARPDLLDRRPAWAGGKLNATSVLLEPLTPAESARLIGSLADLEEGLRQRILLAAEGNPLFVEEMVALVQEAGNGEITVPSTIQALLAARIDQLEAAERSVLERGAVEGRVFHRGAVQALAPEDQQVQARLSSLVRKELVRPDKAQLPGEDAYRFRHLLIRDAAYEALPKETRAALHERFAHWLEQHGTSLAELDEILGYHLEQAWRYRLELGTAQDAGVAAAACQRLAASGRRALLRQDDAGAANLLQRALALVPGDEMDAALAVDLVNALFSIGRLEDAVHTAGASAEQAAAAGDRAAELCCRLEEGIVLLYSDPDAAAGKLEPLIAEAIGTYEDAGNDLVLYTAYFALAQIAHGRARIQEEAAALERALPHAQRAGLQFQEERLLFWLSAAWLHGPTPVSQVLALLEDKQRRVGLHFNERGFLAEALAMLGRIDEAREVLTELLTEMADRGITMLLGLFMSQHALDVEMHAGNPTRAVELGFEGCRLLEQAGERSWLSTSAGFLGQAFYAIDRLEDAEAWAARAAELGGSEDADTQMLWRQVRAKVLARRGEHAEALRLAADAIAIGEQSDHVYFRANARADLAEVHVTAGDRQEAVNALEQALALYEAKGNVTMAERTQARILALERSSNRPNGR